MSESELQKLRSDMEVLKKRLDRLVADRDETGIALSEQEMVTDVTIDEEALTFMKKTRTVAASFLDVESDWTPWHVGTSCDDPATASVSESASFAETMALLHLTGAI